MTITKVPLDDIVTISGGGTPSKAKPEYFTGKIPWVSPKDMKFWDIVDSQDHITEEAIKNSTAKLIAPGAILVVIRSGVLKHSFPIGINKVPVAINQDLKALTCSDQVDATYLARFLQSNARNLLTNVRGTTADNIPTESLRQIQVPLPPLSEQKRIAEILDRAEALRAKRRAALALLDELTQSIFLDMFGDPIHNEKGWQCATLAEIAQFENGDRSSNYPSGDDIKTEGVLFLSTKNIVDRQLELRDAVFITHEKFKSLSRGKLKPMDLIITLRGTLGSCCLFDSDYDTGFINAQMMIIRPRESALPRFLHAMLTTKQAKDQFKRIGHGGAVPQLTATQLSKLVFALPPVDLQKAFCERLHSSEELIAKHETSLGELDQLFASLQHRAFRGELS
ncbi:Type I restriction-modification system, specificity subunit S [Rhodopirellula islandica]|uniref:Type I restriction-modification system, specificity subunit S n=1 Tax=Rhodopirellula islandica TaxID=595434 RepID=A0A0J1BH77_RHOIS|nr:restriction endonuclease subunit S [Rhodopirellula islandica]KLU05880.1 Type I restriction-modification system, specificity subunit S [Rhodopirellula islandica]